jgi:hypothetical protein
MAGLDDSDLPGLFQAADSASGLAQRRFLRWGLLTLACGLAAAVAGTVHVGIDDPSLVLGPAVGAVLFAIGILVTLFLASDRPERRWYDGRAVAESVKTLAWQYAVGGGVFSLAVPGADADRLFVKRLSDVMRVRREFSFELPDDLTRSQITPVMTALRSSPLPARRAVYVEQRLRDQCGWYSRKSAWNARRARQWLAASLLAQGIGLGGGVAVALGWFEVDVLGIAAAGAAAIAAWVQTKDHSSLSEAYAVTAAELALIVTRAASLGEGEDEWGQFVDDAERAISREHTLWLARRGSATYPD